MERSMRFFVEPSFSRILAVCLVLMFACTVVAPGTGVAKVNRVIGTGGVEGDPIDGLEYSGGGSGGGDDNLPPQSSDSVSKRDEAILKDWFKRVSGRFFLAFSPDSKTPIILIFLEDIEGRE
jgi:hypothetical protein